eukprot:Colp12_sorted_trinity150504_noHs@6450
MHELFDPTTKNIEPFDHYPEGSGRRKIARLLRHGYLCDIKVLEECLRANIGDITFQEAYNKTRRILNITVNSTQQYEMPRLLNYLTAPNVIIWSAACASCALLGLYAPVELMAKDSKGRIVPWNPSGHKWSDGSIESDLPMARLSELFNVNHFIVCQVNPHVVPLMNKHGNFFMSGITSKLITSELRHRFYQIQQLGIAPKTMIGLQQLISQKYSGDITIVPPIPFSDYLKIISNPSSDDLYRALQIGQVAAFEKLSIIRVHCDIELALDRNYHMLRKQLFEERLEHKKMESVKQSLMLLTPPSISTASRSLTNSPPVGLRVKHFAS